MTIKSNQLEIKRTENYPAGVHLSGCEVVCRAKSKIPVISMMFYDFFDLRWN